MKHKTEAAPKKNGTLQSDKKESFHTCKAVVQSLSGVFTWHTTLSSIHNTVIGILAPHLSQSAVIPHLIPITPVLLESGRITLGFASIILPPKEPSTSSSPPTSNVSALNHRLKSAGEGLAERERRKRRPLDAADMEINTTGRRGSDGVHSDGDGCGWGVEGRGREIGGDGEGF